MGGLALLIFLCSLGAGLLSLLALVWSGLQIFRTARYAHKDLQAWQRMFEEYSRRLQEVIEVMEKRVRNIGEMGAEMRESVDDIKDVVEDLTRHPLIRAAKAAGKRRK